MTPDAIVSLSVVELARRIRSGELSPVDVMEAYIHRIQATHERLNALIVPTFDAAREEAYRAAEAVKHGDPLGALHGVPFTVKDSFDVAGVPSTGGLTSRVAHIPERDAFLVAKLRAAGAIPLGKTNVPDACWSQETDNLIFGRTNNPYNSAHTVGGSSGGEAAIIGAGASPLGIGSDILGSIRLPSFFTGIVGLRPTSATFSEEGHYPLAEGRAADLEAVGPMARRVEDVALAFDVLSDVPLGADYTPPDESTLRGQKVAFWFGDGITRANQAVRRAVLEAVTALRDAGMESVEKMPNAIRMSSLGWSAYFTPAEVAGIQKMFGNGESWTPLGELARHMRGAPRVHAVSLLYWFVSHYGMSLNPGIFDGVAWRERIRSQLHDLIGMNGVAVCPIFPREAPRHGWIYRDMPFLTTVTYQGWVNLGGLPGLSVPTGISERGLPVGVQIVGMPGMERVLLAAGMAIQNRLSWAWRTPKL
jgi:amidase